LHTSSRRIRAASWRCPTAAAIVGRSTRGTGRKPYPRCLASARSDRTVQLYGRPSPVRSAPRRLVTPTSVVPVAFSPVEPSSQADWISPVRPGGPHSAHVSDHSAGSSTLARAISAAAACGGVATHRRRDHCP
jgi:hypothetical protein